MGFIIVGTFNYCFFLNCDQGPSGPPGPQGEIGSTGILYEKYLLKSTLNDNIDTENMPMCTWYIMPI